VTGKRVETWEELFATPGGYMLAHRGDGSTSWYVKTPNGHIGNLGAHEVEEHEDGTITVSPSILVSDPSGKLYHGFLRRGVWSEA
jgi:hypothetical protein